MSDIKKDSLQNKETKKETNPPTPNPALLVKTKNLPIKHEFAEDQSKKEKTNDEE